MYTPPLFVLLYIRFSSFLPAGVGALTPLPAGGKGPIFLAMLASLLVALAQAVRKAVALLAARAPPVAAPAAVSLSANASDVAKAIRLSLIRWPDGRVKYVPY